MNIPCWGPSVHSRLGRRFRVDVLQGRAGPQAHDLIFILECLNQVRYSTCILRAHLAECSGGGRPDGSVLVVQVADQNRRPRGRAAGGNWLRASVEQDSERQKQKLFQWILSFIARSFYALMGKSTFFGRPCRAAGTWRTRSVHGR